MLPEFCIPVQNSNFTGDISIWFCERMTALFCIPFTWNTAVRPCLGEARGKQSAVCSDVCWPSSFLHKSSSARWRWFYASKCVTCALHNLWNVRELVKAFMLRHKLQVHKSHWSITTRTSSEKRVIAKDVHEMWRVEINSTFAQSCAFAIQENNEQLVRPANIPVPKTRAKNHNKHCFSFASV